VSVLGTEPDIFLIFYQSLRVKNKTNYTLHCVSPGSNPTSPTLFQSTHSTQYFLSAPWTEPT